MATKKNEPNFYEKTLEDELKAFTMEDYQEAMNPDNHVSNNSNCLDTGPSLQEQMEVLNKEVAEANNNNDFDKVLFIKFEDLIPDELQPRKFSDEEDDELQDLANSILSHGIIQPILVKKIENQYHIVTGERRFRAAKIAFNSNERCENEGYDLSVVPVIVTNIVNAEKQLEIQLIENLARKDMNLQDTSRALEKILNNTKITQKELAKRLGKSTAWISKILNRSDINSQKVAEYLSLDVESIGILELPRLVKLFDDECKRLILDNIKERLTNGEVFSRQLMLDEESKYDILSSLNISYDRNFNLEQLKELKKWQGSNNKIKFHALKLVQDGEDNFIKALNKATDSGGASGASSGGSNGSSGGYSKSKANNDTEEDDLKNSSSEDEFVDNFSGTCQVQYEDDNDEGENAFEDEESNLTPSPHTQDLHEITASTEARGFTHETSGDNIENIQKNAITIKIDRMHTFSINEKTICKLFEIVGKNYTIESDDTDIINIINLIIEKYSS